MYICGFKQDALILLHKFNYGPQFIILNEELLQGYCECTSEREMMQVQEQYQLKYSTKPKLEEKVSEESSGAEYD